MDINQNVPDYLLEKKNVIRLVLLTALFALVFINVYEPFGSRSWLESEMSTIKYFSLSSVLVLMGMVVVAISRMVMYYRCNRSKGNHRLSVIMYVVWVVIEVTVMSGIFCFLEMIWLRDEREFTELLNISFRNTSVVLLLPYSFLWLYFSWDDKNKKLAALEEGIADDLAMTHFYDKKGNIIFSVKIADILYIKGTDNYVTVYYLDNQKVSSTIIRNTMKQIEAELSEKGIVRSHRSYMVNTKNIKVLERRKEGFVIKFELPSPDLNVVPVSKSYFKDLAEFLQ